MKKQQVFDLIPDYLDNTMDATQRAEFEKHIQRYPECIKELEEMKSFLQVFEEGRLTDSLGRKIDFRNTIIIMTSNVGSELLREMATLGFGDEESGSRETKEEDIKDKIMSALRSNFKPEFLNRMDEIIIFNSLSSRLN